MFNMLMCVGVGMMVFCVGKIVLDDDVFYVQWLFELMGCILVIDEKYMDVIIGFLVSGLVFFYIVIEVFVDGGVKVGLLWQVVIDFVVQICFGVVVMVNEMGSYLVFFKDEVMMFVGCMVDGIFKFEEGGLCVILIKVIVEVVVWVGELVIDD